MNLDSIQNPVRDELVSVAQKLRQILVPRILEPAIVERLMASAGREGLSATLFLLTARAVGRITEDQMSLAAGCELFRLATWVHDAVIDDVPIEGWPRDLMIIGGDHIFSTGLTLLTAGPEPSSEIASSMIESMALGELEYVREVPTTTTERHVRMLSDKYGSLFGASCELAVLHSGAGREGRTELREYGRSLGRAYKIGDEILSLADTVLRGRVALPVLCTSDPAGEIPRLLDQRDAAGLVQLCASNGGLSAAKARISELSNRALSALSASGLQSQSLKDLCTWISDRVE